MPDKENILRICKIVLWHLSKCLFAFYSGFYMMASLGHGAYRLSPFDARAPFDFITWIDLDRCCQFSPQAKVNLMSMVVGYTALFIMLICSVRKAHWLFVLLLTLVHIVTSCIVMQNFPLLYSYWLSIAVSSFACLALSDIVVFFIEEKTPTEKEEDRS